MINQVQSLLYNCDFETDARTFITRMLVYGLGFALGFSLFFYNYSVEWSAIVFVVVFILSQLIAYGSLVIVSNNRIRVIEEALPDFLTLMSGNIRSGLTPERALLLSARKEFGILSKKIDEAAKATLTGTPFAEAFMGMTTNVHSSMFSKTIRLIVEGVKSGGNLADLLENTAIDIRRFGVIRKEVSATVLSYQLFIFAAVALGAPMLYSVSNFLINSVSSIKSKTALYASDASAYMPLIKGGAAVSPDTVFWFSILALCISSVLGALTAGVISKGKESEGFVYIPVILFLSLGIFFAGKKLLEMLLGGILVT